MIINIVHIFVITLLIEYTESTITFVAPVSNNDIPEDIRIDFVNVIFRHGDRAPDPGLEMYPNDPYKEYKYYPTGIGQLTSIGKRREYELGTVLRHRYNDFLGTLYLPNSVMGISTDYDRTKMSLQLVLAALYLPKSEQLWSKTLNWQPIPVHYLSAKEDTLMTAEECPLYREELEKILNLTEIQAIVEVFRPLMNNLTRWTGKPIKSTNDMYSLYNSLMATYSMGLKLPEWTNNIFPYGELWNATILEYNITNYNTKLRRLYGGMLLKTIVNGMSDVVYNKTNNGRKINLFSGHETNIVSFLATLGLYYPHVPEYSSAVIIELLHNSNNDYYVSLRYYLGIPSQINVLRIPECDINCPFNKFMNLIKDVIPSDADLLCPR